MMRSAFLFSYSLQRAPFTLDLLAVGICPILARSYEGGGGSWRRIWLLGGVRVPMADDGSGSVHPFLVRHAKMGLRGELYGLDGRFASVGNRCHGAVP